MTRTTLLVGSTAHALLSICMVGCSQLRRCIVDLLSASGSGSSSRSGKGQPRRAATRKKPAVAPASGSTVSSSTSGKSRSSSHDDEFPKHTTGGGSSASKSKSSTSSKSSGGGTSASKSSGGGTSDVQAGRWTLLLPPLEMSICWLGLTPRYVSSAAEARAEIHAQLNARQSERLLNIGVPVSRIVISRQSHSCTAVLMKHPLLAHT